MSKENTASKVLPNFDYKFEEVINKDYGVVFALPEEHILICELFNEYTPIEEFKEIFTATVPIIEKLNIIKFIFDKQNLRVFHQPSMEWYFIEWKKEIYAKGLSKHRKILPQNEPAFALAVEAGRAKIRKEFPDLIIDKLDIQYKTTIADAILS